MSQPQQVTFTTPNNDWNSVDNASSPTFPSLNSNTHIGYDTKAGAGAVDQAVNPFSDTGSTTLDSVNDTVTPDPQVATVAGNPVSLTQPTYATVKTVLNNNTSSTRLLWKNPAAILLTLTLLKFFV
jgi:hypothetical protein